MEKKHVAFRPNDRKVEFKGHAFQKVTGPLYAGDNGSHYPSKPGSLVRSLTLDIVPSFRKANPDFKYTISLNPRRVLTKPSEAVSNDSFDNLNADYILYVNDIIGSYTKHQYQILDMLGQGTFGQVVKSVNIDTKDLVAIKIVKNKPAYFNQGLVEIQILEMLNHQYDAENKHHFLRLLDYFVFRNHLCLVFELLSVNLFELIKQNQFRGLSMTLIRCFLLQIIDALVVMERANVLHCDLKPENILLENLTSPSIKIIDFGSACFENQTVFSYIQSRFYRSPEVLIGVKYGSAIDLWSLGCISAELFLGLPLFPGSSEYNQLFRITDMLGPIPLHLLNQGTKTNKFYNKSNNGFVMKTEEQYAQENGIPCQPSKKYFKYKTLPEIVDNYAFKDGLKPEDLRKEKENRRAFIDFLLGLLKLDPTERWTAEQAKQHPFITGEPFTGPYSPANLEKSTITPPRVIPWGIQNSARPQQIQQPISMSFPDFVVGSEPTFMASNEFFSPRSLGHPVNRNMMHAVPPLHLDFNSPGNSMSSPRGQQNQQQRVNFGMLTNHGISPRQYSQAASPHAQNQNLHHQGYQHHQQYNPQGQNHYAHNPQRQRSKSDFTKGPQHQGQGGGSNNSPRTNQQQQMADKKSPRWHDSKKSQENLRRGRERARSFGGRPNGSNDKQLQRSTSHSNADLTEHRRRRASPANQNQNGHNFVPADGPDRFVHEQYASDRDSVDSPVQSPPVDADLAWNDDLLFDIDVATDGHGHSPTAQKQMMYAAGAYYRTSPSHQTQQQQSQLPPELYAKFAGLQMGQHHAPNQQTSHIYGHGFPINSPISGPMGSPMNGPMASPMNGPMASPMNGGGSHDQRYIMQNLQHAQQNMTHPHQLWTSPQHPYQIDQFNGAYPYASPNSPYAYPMHPNGNPNMQQNGFMNPPTYAQHPQIPQPNFSSPTREPQDRRNRSNTTS
eukprot:TRINITY_DN2881_c0_g1_i3.p1 TRINITY_DN2881_c0_g1~~TRINITY_DN2881_c0_g1_i3.p1  ORF type:complete len:952 (-),score=200.28 TRINITY_DN2881_c0_g1_i3:750-3605(-)